MKIVWDDEKIHKRISQELQPMCKSPTQIHFVRWHPHLQNTLIFANEKFLLFRNMQTNKTKSFKIPSNTIVIDIAFHQHNTAYFIALCANKQTKKLFFKHGSLQTGKNENLFCSSEFMVYDEHRPPVLLLKKTGDLIISNFVNGSPFLLEWKEKGKK